MTISVENINKEFNNYKVLNNINFTINTGELVALLGPSGSGKTTLLRIIAGLENQDEGNICINNLNTKNLQIKDREIGFVFQHYALFNHMTIFDNIAFGLRVKPKKFRLTENQIKEKVTLLLKLIQIERLAYFYPKQLSGGQKQRVALARALATQPRTLLLDEPFGALDSKVRKELRKWIRQFHKDINLTSIFVTHDQEEAMEIADKIIIMNHGKIEQIGTPYEVYHNPKNSFIYDFLGNFNLFEKIPDLNVIYNSQNYPGYKFFKKQPKRINKNSIIPKLFSFFKREKFKSIGDKIIDDIKTDNMQTFSRPHNMEVLKNTDDKKYIETKLVHINPAGPIVKLELEKINGDLIYAEISHKYFNRLNPQLGDILYTYPRETTFFSQE